ncbi:hypothetical protein GM921_07540 [Pedobacter sp. LMG 31464]|uniref:Uncharacterized protein n=1 Tax=Pedobacter planticolens TaxID=2679964 RepID=A0A923DYA7_9SPHI|nr:hypothetical protein [Pedobacter planticolens]MBB2145330.1 hypothetical protein [Pedobacter planticolens]
MQSDVLLTIIKSTLSKKTVDELTKIISESDFSFQDLIDLTFHKEEKIGFRASWILETICITNLERFLPHILYFLEKFPQQNNLSCRRHYSKILTLITKKNAPQTAKEIINKYDTDTLVETVFSWLIDEKVPVAIKSHCLNILANLNSKHSWIKEELKQTMDFLVDKESIAFYAKVKQIRKQLK